MATKSTKKSETRTTLESIFQVWGWILLVWSLYRYFLKLPEWVDEFIFKPLVFLGPVLWYIYKIEKRTFGSLGITVKNIFPSIYTGLGFGMVFALEGVLVNSLKNGRLLINPIEALKTYGLITLFILSCATAVSEELLNRGFLFSRIYEKTKQLMYAAIISSVLFVMLHVPILVTTLKFQGSILALFFVTNLLLGVINSLLFISTGSIIAPILVHIFWNMTVALYL
jgi:membrane protease YdiL (CAAX protease family)